MWQDFLTQPVKPSCRLGTKDLCPSFNVLQKQPCTLPARSFLSHPAIYCHYTPSPDTRVLNALPRPLCVLFHLPGPPLAPRTLLLSLKQTREPGPVLLPSGAHSGLESSTGTGWDPSVKPSSSLQPDLGAQRGQGQVLAVLHYRHGRRHEHLGCEGELAPTPASPQTPWPHTSFLQEKVLGMRGEMRQPLDIWASTHFAGTSFLGLGFKLRSTRPQRPSSLSSAPRGLRWVWARSLQMGCLQDP